MLPEGYGFVRTSGYLPGDKDVYVSMSPIRRNELRRGDFVRGQVRPPKESEKYPALQRLDAVNGAGARGSPQPAASSPTSRRSTRTSVCAWSTARSS